MNVNLHNFIVFAKFKLHKPVKAMMLTNLITLLTLVRQTAAAKLGWPWPILSGE